MAFYWDEEDVWQCPKHPSKRRFSGVCPICLHDRLASLCPDCASSRPSSCSPCSSSAGIGPLGRVASLIESEPAFRRSRSMAVPFLRLNGGANHGPDREGRKSAGFWRLFKRGGKGKGKRTTMAIMMRKSRSMAVYDSGAAGESRCTAAAKWKIWYLPSRIKAFRRSTASKMVFQQPSSLNTG